MGEWRSLDALTWPCVREGTGGLSDLLAERANQHPTKVLLRTFEGEYTYAEIQSRSHRLANGLARLGVRASSAVGLFMANSADEVALFFAIAELGAVAIPLNTALRGSFLTHTLLLTRCPIVVVDGSLVGEIDAVLDELPDLVEVVVRGVATGGHPEHRGLRYSSFGELASDLSHEPRGTVKDLDAAMMLFTSGTTGPSKACVLSNRYLLRQGQLHVKYLAITNADVLYTPFPLFHIDAVTLTLVAALVAGGTVAIGARFSASRFWEEVIDFDATIFNFMGATLTILWKQSPSPLERQHRVRLAWGVPMPEWHREWRDRFGFRLYEVYGSTDAGVPVYEPLEGERPAGSCGRVVDEFNVAIGDADGDLLSPGEIGEILVRPRETGTVMSEYFAMPTETLEAFRGLWFHTGDLGRLDDHGYLYFLGRIKDSIRRRGENISAFEVEQLVVSHPAVFEAAAIGVPSELTEEDIKVYVVVRPGEELSAPELLAYCEQRAASFMVPRYVEFLPELPKTPTMKVEKFRLRAMGITAATWDAGRNAPGIVTKKGSV